MKYAKTSSITQRSKDFRSSSIKSVALDVSAVDDMFPAEVSKNVIRRFRVSHREKK